MGIKKSTNASTAATVHRKIACPIPHIASESVQRHNFLLKCTGVSSPTLKRPFLVFNIVSDLWNGGPIIHLRENFPSIQPFEFKEIEYETCE